MCVPHYEIPLDVDNLTNMAAALAELDLQSAEIPSPLNLFMNIPVTKRHQTMGDLLWACQVAISWSSESLGTGPD